MVGNTALAASFVLGPLVAEAELGGAAAWGLILTGGAIGGTLGSVVALRLRPRRPLIVSFPVVTLSALPIVLLIPPAPVLAIAVGWGIAWGGNALANAIWETVLQQHVPREALSRVSSYDWMISLVCMPVGFALAGPAAETIGVDTTLAIAAVLVSVPNLLVLAVHELRNLRRLDAVEVEPEPVTA